MKKYKINANGKTKMNWIKLKEKFPASYEEIREFYTASEAKESKTVLINFLKSKGLFSVELVFIDKLKNYERKKKRRVY